MAKTFTDYNGKKGYVGSKVVEVGIYTGEPLGEVRTVKEIMSRGRAGTRISFEEYGGSRKASSYAIVEER